MQPWRLGYLGCIHSFTLTVTLGKPPPLSVFHFFDKKEYLDLVIFKTLYNLGYLQKNYLGAYEKNCKTTGQRMSPPERIYRKV